MALAIQGLAQVQRVPIPLSLTVRDSGAQGFAVTLMILVPTLFRLPPAEPGHRWGRSGQGRVSTVLQWHCPAQLSPSLLTSAPR